MEPDENVDLNLSLQEVKNVFVEWDRRYRENPDDFYNEAHLLLKETPESCGEGCAMYFVELLQQLREK